MEGLYHRLPASMKQSMLVFALAVSSEVRKDEKAAFNKQRASKLQKQEMLRNNKLIAEQKEY
eukprot:8272497-Ditylum_brightwellii.AAC.1